MNRKEKYMEFLTSHPNQEFKGANELSVRAGVASTLKEAYEKVGGSVLLELHKEGRIQRRPHGRGWIWWYDLKKDSARARKLSLEERVRRLEIKAGI